MHPRIAEDKAAFFLMRSVTIASSLILFGIIGGLIVKSLPILRTTPLIQLLSSSRWRPMQGDFGFRPFISGTMWVTLVSTAIVVPIGLLSAVYLSEYARPRIRAILFPVIDLLAGIPSVVFGVCGVLVVVPFVRNVLAPALGIVTNGYCILSAGIVLAVMVFPFIINITVEIFQSVPGELREASLSLGATKWETIKKVVLKKGAPGIVTAFVLGFARALGETMAVLMVVGNVAKIPRSLFDPAYPLPALIANNYGEMLSIPLYDSALMLAALILLVIVLVFTILSKLILAGLKRGSE